LNDPVANCVRTFSSSTVDQKEIDHSLLLRDIEKLSRHQLDGKPHVCHWRGVWRRLQGGWLTILCDPREH
jgi:hypothetical protein